jgi:cystathionine beta-lyase
MAWVDFRELGLPEEPAPFFLSNSRVAMNSGTAFGANGAGFARLNFATTTSILGQAIKAMGEAAAHEKGSG